MKKGLLLVALLLIVLMIAGCNSYVESANGYRYYEEIQSVSIIGVVIVSVNTLLVLGAMVLFALFKRRRKKAESTDE